MVCAAWGLFVAGMLLVSVLRFPNISTWLIGVSIAAATLAMECMRTGEIGIGGGLLLLKREPIAFWSGICAQLVFVILTCKLGLDG